MRPIYVCQSRLSCCQLKDSILTYKNLKAFFSQVRMHACMHVWIWLWLVVSLKNTTYVLQQQADRKKQTRTRKAEAASTRPKKVDWPIKANFKKGKGRLEREKAVADLNRWLSEAFKRLISEEEQPSQIFSEIFPRKVQFTRLH